MQWTFKNKQIKRQNICHRFTIKSNEYLLHHKNAHYSSTPKCVSNKYVVYGMEDGKVLTGTEMFVDEPQDQACN